MNPASPTQAFAGEESASAATRRVYDAVPYPRLAHKTTHPAQIAALATLLGVDAPRPAACRVLELGCAAGSNLLPMALTLPDARFVGIDLSPVQVEMGRADIAALGLANVELHTLDLLEIAESPQESGLGRFDYILGHGIYSWVPEPVRSAILALIRSHLTPNGIAFVSYNAYPGWHAMDALRRVMLYHVREIADPAQRAGAARELLDLLAEALPPERSVYGMHITAFRDYLLKDEDQTPDERNAYLLHDHLADFNQPFYFHEFAAHLEAAGLQYLCDAEIVNDMPLGIPPQTGPKLSDSIHNPMEMRQTAAG